MSRPSHGILTTPELHEAGYTDNDILRLVRRGFLNRVRRGVFAVGHLALGEDARRMAAVRCGGDGARLASISSAICLGITKRTDPFVDIVVPRSKRAIRGARVVVDRAAHVSPEWVFNGIPTLNPAWTIATMAARVGAGELTRVMREASYHRLLDLSELVAIAERDDRRDGVRTLRTAIDLRTAGSAGYASKLERDVNRYVRRRARHAPLPNVVIRVEGDELEVDMVWRDRMICVEIDGPIHDDPDVRREDERRTRLLRAAGWTVIRIHWTAWEADREAAIAPILLLVGERAG